VSPPRTIPYNPKTLKVSQGISFWLYFFGAQAQSSAPGHRHFPVNMSYYYIYLNEFWPWWKTHRGDWNAIPSSAPSADQRLAKAISPLLNSASSIQSLFRDLCNRNQVQEDRKHEDEPEAEEEFDWSSSPANPANPARGQPDQEPDYTAQANSSVLALQREPDFPSYTTFMRARKDPQFNDVKPRPKHFHCRCPTHAALMAKIELAKTNPREKEEYDMQMRVHHQECKFWRSLEAQLQNQAKDSPELGTVLSYDDTSAIGFPRMTNRPVKSMPNDRVMMTPLNLTNHGTGENVYFYDFKNKWVHGSDRMCTILYHVLHRIKTRPDEGLGNQDIGQKYSKKLYLMADNATPNKNNTLFSFLSELVMRGWYQEVQLLYGPVGPQR